MSVPSKTPSLQRLWQSPLLPSGVSGQPRMAISWPYASDAINYPFQPCFHNWNGNRWPRTGLVYDMMYPATYMLMKATPYKVSTATKNSLLQGGAKPGPCPSRGGFPCPQSLARCHGVGGGYLSFRPFGFLESPSGSTE